MEWFEDFFGKWVVKQRWWIIAATIIIASAASSGVWFTSFTNDNRIFFSGENPQLQALEELENTYNRIDNVVFVIAPEDGNVFTRRTLTAMEELTEAAWYRKQPDVVHINSITTIIKRLNKNMHGDDETYYRIPEEMFTYGSGLTVIWAHISQRNIDSMLGASFLALVLISGLMIFALRSFKLGILSLVPNLTPALMAFGVWGMTVGQIGLGLSVVVAKTDGKTDELILEEENDDILSAAD